MPSRAQIRKAWAALAAGALLAFGAAGAQAAPAAPAEVAFLKLFKSKPRPQADAQPSGRFRGGEGGDSNADGPTRLNPALIAPLEMPVGRRPQRFIPTRV